MNETGKTLDQILSAMIIARVQELFNSKENSFTEKVFHWDTEGIGLLDKEETQNWEEYIDIQPEVLTLNIIDFDDGEMGISSSENLVILAGIVEYCAIGSHKRYAYWSNFQYFLHRDENSNLTWICLDESREKPSLHITSPENISPEWLPYLAEAWCNLVFGKDLYGITADKDYIFLPEPGEEIPD